MTVVLSVVNKGEVFIINELDPKVISYLERNIEDIMIKTDSIKGISGTKYVTLPEGYKINVEERLIKIIFPDDQVKKGPINILY